jgi:hypothetical protein
MIRLVLEFTATTILPNASQGYIGATVFFVVKHSAKISSCGNPPSQRYASEVFNMLQAGAVAKKQKPAVVDPTCLESFDKKNVQVISRHPRGQWIRSAVRARNGHPIGEERFSFSSERRCQRTPCDWRYNVRPRHPSPASCLEVFGFSVGSPGYVPITERQHCLRP